MCCVNVCNATAGLLAACQLSDALLRDPYVIFACSLQGFGLAALEDIIKGRSP